MSKFLFYSFPCLLLLITLTHQVHAQSAEISLFDKHRIFGANMDSLFIVPSDNDSYVATLMEAIGLPENFEVAECQEYWCLENAFAALDDQTGVRYIVYDKEWLGELNSDNAEAGPYSVLAHEIGHHLSGHTLALDEIEHNESLRFCDPQSQDYDRKVCDLNFMNDYLYYLKKSREQELEADRFAGYIGNLIGFTLDDIENTFRGFTHDYDDQMSTHPSLSKRLVAAAEGYAKAEQFKETEATEHDLLDIKGRILNYQVNSTSRIENNRIYRHIEESVGTVPTYYVAYNSDAALSPGNGGGYSKSLTDKMIKVHGDETNPDNINSDTMFFRVYSYFITHHFDKSIYFNPFTSLYIKDGILQLITLDGDQPRVVYQSIASIEDISLKEIEAIFVEYYSKGIERSIMLHNEQSKE